MTLHLPLRSPPHMKKNIGSNLFFNTEHVAHIFTILHYFRILLPTQLRFYISFFRNSYTLHIYITFCFLPLFTCIFQKIIVDLAFRHALDDGCPCCYVSVCPCFISPLSSRPSHHVHPRHSVNSIIYFIHDINLIRDRTFAHPHHRPM